MKRLSIAAYLLVALSALAAAVVQPEPSWPDACSIAASRDLFGPDELFFDRPATVDCR